MQLPPEEAKWTDRPEKPAPASGLWLPYFHTSPYCRPETRLCVCLSRSRVRLFATPWTVASQAPLSMEFSRIYSKSTVKNALICRCQGHMICSPALGFSPARDRDLLPHSAVASGSTADSIFLVRYQPLRKSRRYLPGFTPARGEERSPLLWGHGP